MLLPVHTKVWWIYTLNHYLSATFSAVLHSGVTGSHAMLKKILSFSTIITLVAVVLFGRLIYMNVRADDPLPYGFQDYSVDSFAAAQAEGGLVMVDVYASWCPTCLAQHKVLDDLLSDPAYQNIKAFRVDFDDDISFISTHRVQAQSTIIMFNGSQELSRTIGSTSEQAIRSQLDAAVAQTTDNTI